MPDVTTIVKYVALRCQEMFILCDINRSSVGEIEKGFSVDIKKRLIQ